MATNYEQLAKDILETHTVQRDVSFIHGPGGKKVFEVIDHDYQIHGGLSVEVKNPEFDGTPVDRLHPLPSFVSGLNCFVEPGEPVVESEILARALLRAWDERLPIQIGVQE